MRAAGSIEDYVRKPCGSFIAGSTFLHFFADAGLCGTVLWGRPDEQAVTSLTRALQVELPEHSAAHAAFVDTSGLTSVDEGAFRVLAGYVGPRAEAFGRNVLRQAIVRPEGAIGAMVAGFYSVTPAAYPDRTALFDDRRRALEWLGRTDGERLLAELSAAQAEASSTPSLLRALHDYVCAHPRTVSIRDVAAAQGISPRTLQHQLRALGTSFRQEVVAARIKLAQEFLQRSDTKLTAVALEVGCSSLQHFSNLFRKVTGHSPSEWRALHRR